MQQEKTKKSELTSVEKERLYELLTKQSQNLRKMAGIYTDTDIDAHVSYSYEAKFWSKVAEKINNMEAK